MLGEREGLFLSRSSVPRLLMAARVPAPRRRRRRRPTTGGTGWPRKAFLLQVDGSRHDWLEGSGPYLTLPW
jgi:hypothetical protein